jgi:hypothetical protein
MRAITRVVRSYRSRVHRAAMWGMVPLALTGGWPDLGCVCADGSYLADCPALRVEAPSTAGNCRCATACPAAAESDQSVASCCKPATNLLAETGQPRADQAVCALLQHGNSCHLVLRAGELPTLLQPVRPADESGIAAADVQHAAITLPSFASLTGSLVEDDTGQRPPDLVITLRRLII